MPTVYPIRDPEKLAALQSLPEVVGNPVYRLLATFNFVAALRVSDLLNLKVKDVRTGDGRLRGQVEVVESKTRKTKRIPMFDRQRRPMKTHQALEEYFAAVDADQEDWLFPSIQAGKHISRQQVWRLLKRWAEAVGIDENIGTHSYRKTMGNQAHLLHGVPLTRVQRALNHSDPKVTQVYTCVTDEDAMEAFEAVGAIRVKEEG